MQQSGRDTKQIFSLVQYNAQTDPEGGYAAPPSYEGADPTKALSSYTQN